MMAQWGLKAPTARAAKRLLVHEQVAERIANVRFTKDVAPLPDEFSFQSKLNENVYPYLACFRAIVDAGYGEVDGARYAEGIRE